MGPKIGSLSATVTLILQAWCQKKDLNSQSTAYKTVALPFGHSGLSMVDREGIEPSFLVLHTSVGTIITTYLFLAPATGIEPV